MTVTTTPMVYVSVYRGSTTTPTQTPAVHVRTIFTFITYWGQDLRAYSHRTSALTFVLTLPMTLRRNALIPIAPFTPSISIDTSVKNQMGSKLVQKRQCCKMMSVPNGLHLFEFEDKGEDFYGAERFFSPIGSNMNIYVFDCIDLKSFLHHK